MNTQFSGPEHLKTPAAASVARVRAPPHKRLGSASYHLWPAHPQQSQVCLLAMDVPVRTFCRMDPYVELALSTHLYTHMGHPVNVRKQHFLHMAACSAMVIAVPRRTDVGLFHPWKSAAFSPDVSHCLCRRVLFSYVWSSLRVELLARV